MTFIDLNNNFQSILPDDVGSVVAPSAGGITPATPPDLSAKVTTGSYPNGVPCTNLDPVSDLCPNSQGNAVLDPTLQQPIYTYPSESQRPRLVSQTLIQDVAVLGVGNFMTAAQQAQAVNPTPTAVPNVTPTPGAAPATAAIIYPDTITVIVAPQDAVTLNYLIYSGAELTLVLRGAGDSQRVQTEAVTLQYLMDQYNIPLPAKLPYGTQPRTDMSTPNAPLQLDPRYDIPVP